MNFLPPPSEYGVIVMVAPFFSSAEFLTLVWVSVLCAVAILVLRGSKP